MDEYAHFVYNVTRNFPKEELYGSVSQWRRATLSVVLNYIEGYARKKPAVVLNFYEMSYGSLQESKYLLMFVTQEQFLSKENFEIGNILVTEIGAMLWKEISDLEKSML